MSLKGVIREGVIRAADKEVRHVDLRATRVDILLTAEQSKGNSVFEIHTAPGFDTGAHVHSAIEEIFYVIQGELELRCGDQVIKGGPGTFVFVPVGAAHSFRNPGSEPARMLLFTSPPGHERYFEELAQLLAREGPPDRDAIAALRRKYDTEQIEVIQA